MTAIEKFNKRARAKYLQDPLIDSLIALDSRYCQKYQDTKHCAGLIYHKDGKLTSRYCWHRWCRICNRIRTGELINDYQHALDSMKNKQLVTLTIPNVPGHELRPAIKKMIASMRQIQERYRQMTKKSGRKARGISAIRKLECTYNAEKNNYHPHFHLIVATKRDSNFLLKEWLKLWPEADKKGQDIRPCYSPNELFKYFTKMTSGTSMILDRKGKCRIKNEEHYPEALDLIFQAIERIRIIQPMGNVRTMVHSDIEENAPELFSDEIDETIPQDAENNRFYIWSGQNWYSPYTGELLSSFEPNVKLRIFRHKIRYLEPT